jgi:hypothetical protein
VYYKSPLPSPYRKLLPNLEPYRMPQPVKRSPPSDLIRQQPPREHQPGRYTILFKDLEKVTKSILVSGSGLERRTHENETIIHPRHFDGRRNSCRWKRKERLRGEEIVTPPAGGSQWRDYVIVVFIWKIINPFPSSKTSSKPGTFQHFAAC